ncbi:MAG: hypothetical protein J7L91_05325 [Candidatus Korarchaeota archaeon]|nr:hypothetical protein [Candidatus Korarchaeota archaeon]
MGLSRRNRRKHRRRSRRKYRRGYRRKYRRKNNSDIFTLYALWNNMKDDVLASIVS